MFKTENDDVEKVSAGKKTLAVMAFIVLVVGAISMIVNFGVSFKDDTKVTEWYQLVPVILETIVGLLTYSVFAIVSYPITKKKKKILESGEEAEPEVRYNKKGKAIKKKNVTKIIYVISVIISYAFVIVPFIMDVVEYAKAVSGD